MIKVYCDGSITRNPRGHMKYAFVVDNFNESGDIPDTEFNTNWVAESTALKQAMYWLLSQGVEKEQIIVYSDLDGLVRMMKKDKCKVNDQTRTCTFYPIIKEIFELKKHFNNINFEWIPREQNLADLYCNQRKNG